MGQGVDYEQITQADIPTPYQAWLDPEVFVHSVRYLTARSNYRALEELH